MRILSHFFDGNVFQGRGFNTGVIMMDLDRLRDMDFKTKWRAVANKYLRIHGKTTMSDQDIFNAYLYEYPQEVKTLPCAWNYQLGVLSKSDKLCFEEPQALHFNSQNKTVRKNYLLYNAVRKEIDGIDGTELRKRRSLVSTHPAPSSPTPSKTNTCEQFLPLQNFRVLPNALGKIKENPELCLVTQFSKDRLHSFVKNARKWNRPISAAIYGKDSDLAEIADVIKALNRSDIAIHMVFEEESTYPINFLRNVAINHTECVNMLLADADFIIYGDYKELEDQARNLTEKEVLVIPAFETTNASMTDVSKFPQTKKDVVLSFFNKTVQMFRGKSWPNAHNATNIVEWIAAEHVYSVNYNRNYEPYFIIKKTSCPMYDLRFGGYGWNKVTHVLHLRMLNFKFLVSPSSFMIHQDHTISESLVRWRQDSHYQKCLHDLKYQFLRETATMLGFELHD
ncbi:hypothetical protein L3Y34_011162 [Caenorhabditis briggsae]|uniref:Uncharacterized protein n=2 Tax=Caenorhabditis briggsae TaxID=6238 RepID=A0AAE8ZS65_CAEBR|nr:hypothetical protein L3Y34_011162 [Caenorhabditis briggsae]